MTTRTKIFVSYSHADRPWLKRLQVHLKPLERDGLVELWDDSRIKPGMKWQHEIRAAMSEARVAVLLISADFLASDFIATDELPPLLKIAETEGATILPLIVSPSRFEQTPALSVFQSVNDPRKPLSRLAKAEREEVFARLTDIIHQTVTQITSAPPTPTPKPTAPPTSRVTVPQTRGEKSLLADLAACSPTELTDRILEGTFTLDELNAAVRDDRDGASALLHAISQRLGVQSDTWLRMLSSQVASQMEEPGQDACAVAFDRKYHWGARSTAITWLRFVTRSSRDTTGDRLYDEMSAGDVDSARLVVSGMGFLANTLRISDVISEYSAFKNAYGNEKIGPYAIMAYLDCFVHHGAGWLPTDVLRLMSDMYRATEEHGHMHLSEFNIFSSLQVMTPGQAVNLLDHLAKNRHLPILIAVLWLLKDRSNRNALAQLRSIVDDADISDYVRGAAVDAIGRIRSAEALEISLDYARRYPTTWNNGALLSIGTNRSEVHVGVVRDALTSNSASQATASWALGELARNGEAELAQLLRQQTEQSKDAVARAIAWSGLAKAGVTLGESELDEAADSATSYGELVILGIAAAQCGRLETLRKSLHSAQVNHAPIWRLEGHLSHDYRSALLAGVGEPGRIFVELLKRGDID